MTKKEMAIIIYNSRQKNYIICKYIGYDIVAAINDVRQKLLGTDYTVNGAFIIGQSHADSPIGINMGQCVGCADLSILINNYLTMCREENRDKNCRESWCK